MTLTIASVGQPSCFASRSAARESAVSPDWEMITTSEFFYKLRRAVAELGGKIHLHRYVRDLFDHILAHRRDMIGGAAGHDVETVKLSQRALLKLQRIQTNRAVLHIRVHRIPDRLRLLVNFLDHEMLVPAFFGRCGIPLDGLHFLLNLIAVKVIERDAVTGETAQFHVADIVNVSCVVHDGRDVRSDICAVVRDAEDHRAVLPRDIDLAGIVPEHQGQRIGAADSDQRVVN